MEESKKSKKKVALIGSDGDEAIIAGIIAATKEAVEVVPTKAFSPEEVDLPVPIPIKPMHLAPADLRKFRRVGNIEGDRFYDYLKYKRHNGKVIVKGSFLKTIKGGLTKVISKSVMGIDGKITEVDQHVVIRRQSKPSKAFIERQKKTA